MAVIGKIGNNPSISQFKPVQGKSLYVPKSKDKPDFGSLMSNNFDPERMQAMVTDTLRKFQEIPDVSGVYVNPQSRADVPSMLGKIDINI